MDSVATPNKPRLRVGLAQLPSLPGQVDANLMALEACLGRMAPDCDLVCFCELFLCGYGPDEAAACAEPADGPSYRRVSAAARAHGVAVVYGFAELNADGVTKHIALNWVSKEGGLVLTYRKAHLWTPSAFESNHFTRGTEALAPLVELRGVRVGVLICFDVEVVEPARHLALQGCQLLLVHGCNGDPFTVETLVKVRAFENHCHLIYVNSCDAPCCGGSAAVDPRGNFLDPTPLPGAGSSVSEAVVCVDPERPDLVDHRLRNPLFAVRQPHMYKLDGHRSDGHPPPARAKAAEAKATEAPVFAATAAAADK